MTALTEKIRRKCADPYADRPLTIAFLGDSVTQGCFEIYARPSGGIGVVTDSEAGYPALVRRILALLYPDLPVTVVNAGICGDSAPRGLARLERDVLSCRPDLTVVCYGLNDCCAGIDHIGDYTAALGSIFDAIRAAGSDVIFLTPNVIGAKVSDTVTDPYLRQLGAGINSESNRRSLDACMDAARELCGGKQVPVCDCYRIWEQMEAAGVDVTALLANDINHPIRELHRVFAYELVKTMLSQPAAISFRSAGTIQTQTSFPTR